MSPCRCNVEGGAAILITEIGTGTLFEEKLNDGTVALGDGEMERGLTVFVSGVDVETGFEKQAYDGDVASADCKV